MNIHPLYSVVFVAVVAFTACKTDRTETNDCSGDSVCAELTAADAPDDSTEADAYVLTDSCAGPFILGAAIPLQVDGFTMTESTAEGFDSEGQPFRIPVYTYEIGNEGWVKITPQFDVTSGDVSDKTGEIIVNSDLFVTDKGIGAMSSLREFAAAYPDLRISYDSEAELFVVETPRLRNVQFVIGGEYYQGNDSVFASEASCKLQLDDFKDQSYFTIIRITT